ncbi:MAG: arcadin 1 [Thermoprotei archaeon]|nr:arcadin 1 [Thermoprotei archaeon]
MPEVSFRAVLVGKNVVSDPFGGKNIKLELIEEREVPMPMIIEGRGQELAREIAPIVRQVMRSLPFTGAGRIAVPRLTIWLTEDEWDRLEPKPDIGDELIITIKSKNIEIRGT